MLDDSSSSKRRPLETHSNSHANLCRKTFTFLQKDVAIFSASAILYAMTNNNKLQFAIGNAKLAPSIANFSLPAGWTCPFAKECFSKSNLLTGRITDGKHCRFRCFAATNEARSPSVRRSRWRNFNLLREARSVERMAQVIQDSLPAGMDKVRIHVSGDFYSERYFLAWLNVALNNPFKVFYGYTKALTYLIKYRQWIPDNFRFTASKGGTHDHLIHNFNLPFAEVVFSIEEAEAKGLQIDHDDSLAFANRGSFALLLHATQPQGTPAATAWAKLMRDGIGGYTAESGFRKKQVARSVTIHVTLRQGTDYHESTPYAAKSKFKFTPKFNGSRTIYRYA